jgi:hypothetical protein
VTEHEADDHLARLIDWHTPEIQTATETQAVDPQQEESADVPTDVADDPS